MKPEEGPIEESKKLRVSRGISILDLVLRIIAIFGTLGSAVAMGTTDETLPFSTQALIFQAQYDDIPTFRTRATKSRALLIFLDTIMLDVLTAGASAAAAVVYLAHKGNASANWLAICQQYQNFCERITGSLIGSFGAVLILILLIPLSGLILSRRR
ncbi:hypothetical protein DH2020_026896 [Rehmannia glutinosa]|uniref:CASP-like protein n=1 Tax=Rehmannia glutinosa TaxID=99300 RepID=A0ABR0VVQ3_REHGL